MRTVCAKIVDWPWFERIIIAIIILNAIALGVETYPPMVLGRETFFVSFNQIVLVIFVFEAVVKIIAVAPKFSRYFW